MLMAFFSSVIIGISLGFLGAGGSVIALPILIYILERPEKLAIAESMAVVGFAAFAGAIPYAFRNQIQWKSFFLFGIPGMFGACVGGCGTYYISASLQMVLFSITMLFVSFTMFYGHSFIIKAIPQQPSSFTVILEGFFVGCLTGLIGVGGGFLIVPALLILFPISMSIAVGTSLIIIAVNSFTGFIFQLMWLNTLNLQVDWKIIGMVAIAAILGSFFGSLFANRFSQIFLRKAFGLSVFIIGLYTLFTWMKNL